MASRGQLETNRLKENLETQLDRLVAQLSELEQYKNDLEPEEYEETKKETIEQLEEFQKYLTKFLDGNITLVDDLNAMQLAIQAAISNAFQTPEIIRLFAKKQLSQLRLKLAQIEVEHKVGGLDKERYTQQKVEILSALEKLNDELKDDEKIFLKNNLTDSLKEFNQVTNQSSAVSEQNVANLLQDKATQ